MISVKSLRFIATCSILLAIFVVMLGAYTRLTDAGLGCPDWPGCYGQMVLPTWQNDLKHAQNLYPQIPIESTKAWTEMAHRYAAGSLALLVVAMACMVFVLRRRGLSTLPCAVPCVLLLLIAFQAALGMWTVTLKLLPIVVMGHLLGGILIFSSLCFFRWQLSRVLGRNLPIWRVWIGLGVGLVFCQIALGGWVSSNYAGIACIGFPLCNGQWLPHLHLLKAFNVFSSLGTNYQGGVLDHEVRATIQWVHRLGAYIIASYVVLLSSFIIACRPTKPLRWMAFVAVVLVCIQFALGVANVVYLLPLWIAVAHNGVAALLLAAMVSQYYLAKEGRVHAG